MNKKVVLLRSNPVNPDPPVEKIAETLLKNGYAVTIVAWDRENDYSVLESDLTLSDSQSVKIVRFGIKAVYGGGLKKTLKAFLGFQKRLSGWLKKNRNEYDIIHAFDFDTGYVAKKAARKYKKQFVYHILDFYVDSHLSGGKILRGLIKKLEYSVIKTANVTIVCTEKRLEQIKGSKPKKVEIIHNTPKVDFLNQTSELKIEDSKRLKIVYVGIFGEGRLIRELLQMVAEDNTLELHIGGFGELEDCVKEFAKDNDNIFYYGKLSYRDTLALERQCDVMTAIYDPSIPNHRYAAPNKFYESLMLGKPIVMVKNTGFDDVIVENEIGVLIDYSKEGAIAGITTLKANRDDFDNMAKRSQTLYENSFSWQEMANRITAIYQSL